jgi:hypothetical protein
MRIERPPKRNFIHPRKTDELNDRISRHAGQFSGGNALEIPASNASDYHGDRASFAARRKLRQGN